MKIKALRKLMEDGPVEVGLKGRDCHAWLIALNCGGRAVVPRSAFRQPSARWEDGGRLHAVAVWNEHCGRWTPHWVTSADILGPRAMCVAANEREAARKSAQADAHQLRMERIADAISERIDRPVHIWGAVNNSRVHVSIADIEDLLGIEREDGG